MQLQLRIYSVLAVVALVLGAACAPAAEPAPPPDLAAQAPGTFVWRGHYFLTSEPALAWDRVHGRFVGWGGHHLGHEQSDDAWVFAPEAPGWKLMPQINAPRACCCANQLGSDARRGRILVFGDDGDQSHGWMSVTVQGLSRSIPTLYDCDANRWTPMRPVPEPPGSVRQHKGFVYHPGLDLHVLVSGKEMPGDTWVYDAHRNEWRELHPANPPPPLREAALAVHPDTGEIVLANGGSNGVVRVLSIPGNAWREVAPSHAPPALVEPCFVFDPHAGCFVLLGSLEKGKGDPLQIWTLDPGLRAWQHVELPEDGEVPGRTRKLGGFGFGAAYAPERNIYLLVGGEFGNNRFHTWTWRLAPTQPQLPPASPALQPPVRRGPPAPAAPAVAGLATNAVELALPEPSAAGGRFVVERAPVRTQRVENKFKHIQVALELGAFAAIGSEPVHGASITDAVDLARIPDGWRFEQPSNAIAVVYGKPEFAPPARYNPLAVYAYRVREVDAAGATSGPSPWVLTLPAPPDTPAVAAPPPDDPQSGIVTLSWNAPRRKGIVGYRVYRQLQRYLGPEWMQPWVAPYHEDPKVWYPLSTNLMRETRFVDATIPGGNNRRRYYVAAIDAFGQEGAPSAGAWAYRAENFDLPGPMKNLPRATLPELAEEAVIDGRGDDPVWQKAARFDLRLLDGRVAAPSQPTEVRIFTHKGWLYAFGVCREEVMGEVVAHTNWPHDTTYLWMDDTLEFSFILDPKAGGKIHHLMFAMSGVSQDGYGPLGAIDRKAWDPNVEQSVNIGQKEWSIEFRFRLNELHGYTPERTEWRANIFRNRQQTARREQEESAWSPPYFSEAMVPERFGIIELRK
jgi:hypothetical protein